MSRIGELPISFGSNVQVDIESSSVVVKGPLGILSMPYKCENISFKITNNQDVLVSREIQDKLSMSLHGTYRAILSNMISGVIEKFTVKLVLVGIGYRASLLGKGRLDLSLGYSHSLLVILPSEVEAEVESKKGSDPKITLSSIDKQLLFLVASKVRSLRPPEPYKGKGIRYLDEEVRRKVGKSGSK